MKRMIKRLLNTLPKNWQEKINQGRRHYLIEKEIKQWIKNGKPNPPPAQVKHRNLLEIAQQKGLSIFVETGTYMGATVDALKEKFEKIYSIELSEDLFLKAKNRFSDQPHVFLIQGDSGVILKRIISELNGPTLFWLDAHYSSGITARGDKTTPILEELSTILTDKNNHVIFIDDARDFHGHGDYPYVKEIASFVEAKKPDTFTIEVVDDAIRIIPKQQ